MVRENGCAREEKYLAIQRGTLAKQAGWLLNGRSRDLGGKKGFPSNPKEEKMLDVISRSHPLFQPQTSMHDSARTSPVDSEITNTHAEEER